MSLSTVRQRILSDSNTNTGSIQDEMKSYSMTPVPNDGINVYGNVRINPETSGPYSDSGSMMIMSASLESTRLTISLNSTTHIFI